MDSAVELLNDWGPARFLTSPIQQKDFTILHLHPFERHIAKWLIYGSTPTQQWNAIDL